MNGGYATRAALTAAAAVALSLSLAGAAIAAPASHRIAQVTGSVLETALLPPAAFGKGYTGDGASDSGGALRPASPARSVRKAYCTGIEGGGSLAGYGDTAEANRGVSASMTAGPALRLIYQDVAQFRTSRAARAFFGQVLALYRRCGSFASFAGFVPIAVVLVHGGITTARIDDSPAFRVDQDLESDDEPGPGAPFGYAKTIFVVVGPDVYETMLIAGRDVPLPEWVPVRLISRVRTLYR
jgi:hypothetical protein